MTGMFAYSRGPTRCLIYASGTWRGLTEHFNPMLGGILHYTCILLICCCVRHMGNVLSDTEF